MSKFWEGLPENDVKTFHRIAGLYFYDSFTHVVKLLDQHWDSLSRHEALFPELYRMKAYSLMKLGQTVEALKACAKALELDPDNVRFRENLAGMEENCRREMDRLSELNEWKQQEELTEAYLNIFPNNPSARWYLAVSLDERGEHARAVALFSELVREVPTRSVHWHSWCVSLRRSGRLDEAIRRCREGIATLERSGINLGELPGCLSWLEAQLTESEGGGNAVSGPTLQ